MVFVVLLISLLSILVTALVIFGGGQVFIPVFKSMWLFLNRSFPDIFKISSDEIDTVVTTVNSTPGVLSTKMAFLTGYFIGYGQWYSYLFMILTYLIFISPGVIVMLIVYKKLVKNKENPYVKNVVNILKPVIVGITMTILISMFISAFFLWFSFNDQNGYIIDTSNSEKALFFSGYRKVALFIFLPVASLVSWFMLKKNIPPLLVLFPNIIVGFLVFQPWL